MKKIYVAVTVAATMISASFTIMAAETVNDILGTVKQQVAPDRRQAVFDVRAVGTQGGKTEVIGVVSEASAKDALTAALGDKATTDGVAVLPADRWGQVRIPVACMRVNPGHASEMATQSIMGTPLRILGVVDGDYWVQTPDGYIGYMPSSSLVEKTDGEMERWRGSDRLVVTSHDQTDVYTTPRPTGPRDIVTDLVNGSVVEGKMPAKAKDKMVEITLPDGRHGWVKRDDVTPVNEWASQDFNADVILDMAYSLHGTPYLWGGMSSKALDCSGLAKVSYLANGIILMRDASQQATTGTVMTPDAWRSLEAGDLLFFGNPDTGRVTHVAIYDRDGKYIHSSGRVKVNSIDPDGDDYLTTPHLSSSRIKTDIGSRGITRVIDHPWFFNK